MLGHYTTAPDAPLDWFSLLQVRQDHIRQPQFCQPPNYQLGGRHFFAREQKQEKGGRLREKRKEKQARAMKKESMDQQWRALSEEILFGLKKWREEHPKATLLEIEEEVSRQMSRLGAQVIQDAAQSSEASDWTSLPAAQAPRCQQCGSVLVSRGKRRRRLQSSGGAAVELVRSYGTCPTCGVGLFPPR